jgi:hypothetical protein
MHGAPPTLPPSTTQYALPPALGNVQLDLLVYQGLVKILHEILGADGLSNQALSGGTDLTFESGLPGMTFLS